jgi:hypothetical protein
MPIFPKMPIVHVWVLLWIATALTAQNRKHALLIGVGRFASPDFSTLQAEQGVQLMYAALLSKGFVQADMAKLINADATRGNIDRAFARLEGEISPGDVVLVHFYGHGVQIDDDNRDEVDMLDEAFVPYDGQFTDSRRHQRLLRDDDLGRYIDRLRARAAGAGGQVCVVFDACHSGTALRSRSTYEAATDQRTRLTHNPTGDSGVSAPLIVFYSSMPHQVSLETAVEAGKRSALLTWAFCKSLESMHPVATYRSLFEQVCLRIMEKVEQKQTPLMEGVPDYLVFGERLNQPPPYYRVLTSTGHQELVLKGGLLHGLQAGTKLVFFPPDTRDTSGATPIARGVVTDRGLGFLECTVQFDRPLTESDALNSWVFVRAQHFGPYAISIAVDADDPVVGASLRRQLSGMESLVFDSPAPPELLMRSRHGRKLVLQTAEGEELWSGGHAGTLPPDLHRAIDNFLQARFLRSLAFESSPYRIGFSVNTPASGSPAAPVGLSVRRNKEVALLHVENLSPYTLYYTVLDIDARHAVNVLIPGAGWNPAEFRLKPGEKREHRVTFDAPGREVLKLIATLTPVDLRDVVATRGKAYEGSHFFEQLFAQSYLSRGPASVYVDNEVGVATVIVDVVE